MSLGWWEGLVLGLVQGLTEFLPVSSSGHLVVAEGLLGYASPGVAFEVALHLATLLSVLLVYRLSIAAILGGMAKGNADAWRRAFLLVVASLPAAVVGFGFQDQLTDAFGNYTVVGLGFLVTASVLWSTRRAPGAASAHRPGKPGMTYGTALLIGLAQALAILPGVSRSGTTITAALWRGIGAERAAEFSFLMAVIAIAGSGLLEARHLEALPLTAGLVTAFLGALVSGIVAIRSLVWLLRSRRFHAFAPYVALIGVFTLIWFRIAG